MEWNSTVPCFHSAGAGHEDVQKKMLAEQVDRRARTTTSSK
jgi:hypothetical protein